jgi:hypothetical protein
MSKESSYLSKLQNKTDEVFNAKYMADVYRRVEKCCQTGINRVVLEYPYHILSRIKIKLEAQGFKTWYVEHSVCYKIVILLLVEW